MQNKSNIKDKKAKILFQLRDHPERSIIGGKSRTA
jgi:hypothetical protein